MAGVIYTIGETLLDIIFRDGRPVSATPGGAMLNTAVSLGRAGLKVEFISEYGKDQTGGIIDLFLKENHVGTRFVNRYADGKTALALAFLDRKRNASYSFYKSYPRIRMKNPFPLTKKADVILFGSIYSITPGIHTKIKQWIRRAKTNGTLIIYDPNFRMTHSDMLVKARPRIVENIALADIVRGSDEDFLTVLGLRKPEEVKMKLRSLGCKNIIITRNSKRVIAWFGDKRISAAVPPVKPIVSTVGAGDSFNAGIIYALVNGNLNGKGLENMMIKDPETIVNSGISFAAEVCKTTENYISPGFSKSLRS